MCVFCIQMQILEIMHESWGSFSLLFRILSYQLTFDPFNWHFILYPLCLWKTNLSFSFRLCAILKNIKSAWFIHCNLALFWEFAFSFLVLCLIFLNEKTQWAFIFLSYLLCSLILLRYLQLYLLKFYISSIDICFNWYLLWELWYLVSWFYFTWYLSSNILSFGIFASSWYLIFNWCLISHVLFDSIPIDISHFMCWCVLESIICWFDLSSIMCWFGFWYNLDNHFMSHFGVPSCFSWCFCPNCISLGSRKSLHAYLLIYIPYGMLVFLLQYIGYTPPNPKSAVATVRRRSPEP